MHDVRRRHSRQRIIHVDQIKQATLQQIEIELRRLHIAPLIQSVF